LGKGRFDLPEEFSVLNIRDVEWALPMIDLAEYV
jgi:hypothetical protein